MVRDNLNCKKKVTSILYVTEASNFGRGCPLRGRQSHCFYADNRRIDASQKAATPSGIRCECCAIPFFYAGSQ